MMNTRIPRLLVRSSRMRFLCSCMLLWLSSVGGTWSSWASAYLGLSMAFPRFLSSRTTTTTTTTTTFMMVTTVALVSFPSVIAGADEFVMDQAETEIPPDSKAEDDDDEENDQDELDADVCESESDVDFVDCTLEDLSQEALAAICERMDLNVVEEIFPHILEELKQADPGEYEPGELEAELESIQNQDHNAFVAAAWECLMVEDHLLSLNDDEDHGDIHDPYVMADIVQDIMERQPDIVHELEAELRQDHPDIWESIEPLLTDGDKLIDRPDVLGQLIRELLEEDPEIFFQIDEEFSPHADDDDSMEEEL